jgi:DNA-binding transcriptional LysR family regulator
VVCAAPAYLRRAGRPETPSDLTRHACLIYTEGISPTTWRFEGPGGQRETLEVSGRVSSTNVEFNYQLALAGHGVIRAPSFTVGMDIAEGRLVALLTDWRLHSLPIHVVYPHRPLLSAKVRSFVDFLAQRFGPTPEWERWREGAEGPSID